MTKRGLHVRGYLPHEIPSWVEDGSSFFITVCCEQKGVNQLCRKAIFREIKRTSDIYVEKSLWYPHLLLLMPDHFHGLVSFGREANMKKVIANFKRYLATKCKVSWQNDFFDHRIRNDENYQEKADYILNNPVRKGLCATSGEWFWVLRHS